MIIISTGVSCHHFCRFSNICLTTTLVMIKKSFLFVCSLTRLKSLVSSATETSSSSMVRLLRLPTMELSPVRFFKYLPTVHKIHYRCATEPPGSTLTESAAAESACTSCMLLNTEWCRGFYGSICECQRVQEVHTLVQ